MTNNPELSFLIEALHLNPNDFFDAFYQKYQKGSFVGLLNETVWKLTLQKVNVQALRNYNSETVEAWDAYVKDEYWRVIGGETQSIFEFIRKISRNCLVFNSKEPFFKIDRLNVWQDVSSRCGEDLFVAALSADKMIQDGTSLGHFQWKYIIKSDFFLLNNLIHQRKLVENHYHLGGSSPNVDLSWIYLMNNPFGVSDKFQEVYEQTASFYPSSQSYLASHHSNLEILVQIAASIRMWLFEYCILRRKSDYKASGILNVIKQTFDVNVYMPSSELRSKIDMYRYQTNYSAFDTKVDYAIHGFNIINDKGNTYIAGERYLTYSTLYYIFTNPYDANVQLLYYIYILIKNRFGLVFIQSNNKTGFQNFREYSKRKSYFIRDTPYYEMANNMAVHGNIEENDLRQLEVRIMPRSSSKKLIGSINNIENKAYLKSDDETLFSKIFPEGVRGDEPNKIDKGKDKYFYVLHFIKQKEPKWYGESKNRFVPMCREYEMRESYMRDAECFMEMRNKGYEVCDRIYGIDAASNEVNFRPENFGTVFRYLASSRVTWDVPWDRQIPDLHKTFHVGEDFYEMVDGFRAIEEAVLYLELSQGDRIGHGVVLGLDVEKWYERHPEVVLPLQNQVDNLAWLLFKIREWDLEIPTSTYHRLHTELERAYMQLYKNKFSDLLTYMRSWRLRGDNPVCYADENYDKRWLHPVTQWERYSIRDRTLYEKIETNRMAYDLYHRYHYDIDVKQEGLRKVKFEFEPFYVDLVKQLQIRMRSFILEKGVAVESCPTSNYLISNVDKFHEIPTFNLFPIEESHNDLFRLNVSINTDDQGVFYTSLIKEYSLLAGTLRHEMKNGLRLYSDDKILNWIEHLINNSKQQCFREVEL